MRRTKKKQTKIKKKHIQTRDRKHCEHIITIIIITDNQNTECHAKESRKETKIQELMHRDTTNEGYQVYEYTVTAGVTGVVRKELKKMCKPQQENSEQFQHKNSYTRNITHNAESAAV